MTRLDAELYRVAEQLVDQRWEARATAEAAPGPPDDSLLSAADFTFDQPIHGCGWHVRERGERGWYCWTDQEAVLHLGLKTTGDHTLECAVDHAACLEAWQGLEITVNGSPVGLTSKPDGPPGIVVARVPEPLLGDPPGPVRVGLRVPRTVCPNSNDPSNPDARRLGVAVSRVRLRPSGGAE
jgi:hypothetical protein